MYFEHFIKHSVSFKYSFAGTRIFRIKRDRQKIKFVAFVDVDAGAALKRSSSSGVLTSRSSRFPPLPPFCPLRDPFPIRCVGFQKSMCVLSVVSDIKVQSPSYRTAMAKSERKCMQNADANFCMGVFLFHKFSFFCPPVLPLRKGLSGALDLCPEKCHAEHKRCGRPPGRKHIRAFPGTESWESW